MVSSRGNTSDTSIYRYTSARESTAAPAFPAGAKVTVDEVTENSAKVHFPAARAGSDSNLDMVHEYKITATPASGDSAVKRIFSDYYRPAAYIRKTWDVMLKGLLPGTSYTVSVVAQTSWNKERGSEGSGSYSGSTGAAPNSTSAAIVSAAFNTSAKTPAPRAILDIDFRTGKPDDAMGHAPQLFGTGTIVEDTDVLAGGATKVYQSAAATGMVIPGPKYYYVGCDTNSDGNLEFLTKSVIALLILAHHATSHQHVAIVACWWLCLAGITHWMKKGLSALPRK